MCNVHWYAFLPHYICGLDTELNPDPEHFFHTYIEVRSTKTGPLESLGLSTMDSSDPPYRGSYLT